MTPNVAGRDEAIDVARAIAILGMFIIHAVLVLGVSVPTHGAAGVVLWLCDGRAAATFVTLAGFGVARLASRYNAQDGALTLRRRALVLWTMGVLNLIVWPGDILRLYGVALWLAPSMLRMSVRARMQWSVALVIAFPLVMMVIDWTTHWQLDTLTYVGVWTPAGFVRNLMYDGFRPVVPWLAFFLMGTVLAEQPLQQERFGIRLIAGGAFLSAFAFGLSWGLDQCLQQVFPGIDALTRKVLAGTTSMPPLPLFLLSASGTTSFIIGATVTLVPRLPRWMVDPLVATGRRALTWYLLHIALLISLYALSFKQLLPPGVAIASGAIMFIWAAIWSQRQREKAGLFERFMRWATQPIAKELRT